MCIRDSLRIAHQFVEMDLGWGDECTRTATPDHQTLAFETGERLACGHETNAVNTRKFPLGVYEITGFQKAPFEPFNDR